MKKKYLLLLIILLFLGRGCAFGASAPTQTHIQTIDADFKNIKPISELNTSGPTKSKAAITSNPPAKTITTNTIKTTPQTVTTAQPTQPQPVDFGLCSKFFKLDKQKLFYLTLASVNANRFEIKEIQSKSGYILFIVGQRPFIASIIKVDATNSMLKITPCNNVYFFPVGIVQNMFKYIELNINTPVEKLSVL